MDKIKELLSHKKREFGIDYSRERKLAQKKQRKKQARSKGIKNNLQSIEIKQNTYTK